MKYLLVIFLFLSILAGIFLFTPQMSKNKKKENRVLSTSISQPTPTSVSPQDDIFIPYWGIDGKTISDEYTSYIYFGIAADSSGINHNDPGFKNIVNFLRVIPKGKKKLLTVRLLNQDENEKILNDKTLQQKIIDQTIQISRTSKFDGIVLDFELSALGFSSVTDAISGFGKQFGNDAHNNNLTFAPLLYGDTFYRARPYNVKTFSQVSDTIFIMAYDFHKAKGDPGANFPLHGKEIEGYDFTQMVDDFGLNVKTEKIAVVFGLFGYDWKVNEKNQSIDVATSLSDNQIMQKFFPHCLVKECKVIQDKTSTETEITYKDVDNLQHELWFENMDSIKEKEAYLITRGITHVALWAYSYF